jgi:hypothetical protein
VRRYPSISRCSAILKFESKVNNARLKSKSRRPLQIQKQESRPALRNRSAVRQSGDWRSQVLPILRESLSDVQLVGHTGLHWVHLTEDVIDH